MLKVGDLAPAFSLLDQDGECKSLSDYIGSITLIYFYPKDDTPGCTKEACSIRDAWADYKKAGVQVVGISSDAPESHKVFQEKYKLPFTLLSDRDRSTIAEYGAKGIGTKRISYLIGPDGCVLKAYPKVDPALHADEILADVKKFSK
jgi:peroxiredoxin Q/BCP